MDWAGRHYVTPTPRPRIQLRENQGPECAVVFVIRRPFQAGEHAALLGTGGQADQCHPISFHFTRGTRPDPPDSACSAARWISCLYVNRRSNARSHFFVNRDRNAFCNFQRHHQSVPNRFRQFACVGTAVHLDGQRVPIRNDDCSIPVKDFVLNRSKAYFSPVTILPCRCKLRTSDIKPETCSAVLLRGWENR